MIDIDKELDEVFGTSRTTRSTTSTTKEILKQSKQDESEINHPVLRTYRRYPQFTYLACAFSTDSKGHTSKRPLPSCTGWSKDGRTAWSGPVDRSTIDRWIQEGATGLGLLTGQKHADKDAYLEVLDFDDAGSAWSAFATGVNEVNPALLDRIPRVQTQSGGYHLIYYCEQIEGAKKLATTKDKRVLIETRGHGGFIVAPTTVWQDKSWSEVHLTLADAPVLTTDERSTLWAVATSLSEVNHLPVLTGPEEKKKTKGQSETRRTIGPDDRAGSAFNHAPWSEVQQYISLPFTHVTTRADGVELWCRDGKSDGISATYGAHGLPLFYVFSTSSILDAPRAYDHLGLYAFCNHGGDFSAAAKALAAIGYGATTLPFASKDKEETKTRTFTPPSAQKSSSPSIDISSLPEPLRSLVREVSTALKVEPLTVTMWALATISAATQNRFAVTIPDTTFEQVKTNLYLLTIADSGSYKSEIKRYATTPLVEWMERYDRQQKISRAKVERELKDLHTKEDGARDQMRKRESSPTSASSTPPKITFERLDDLREQIDAKEEELESIPLSWSMGAPTPEAMLVGMSKSQGRCCILTSEGSALKLALSTDEKGFSKEDLLLKAYDGEAVGDERIGRGTCRVYMPDVVLGLTCTPETWQGYLSKGAFRESGLLSRFTITFLPPPINKRFTIPKISPSIRERWARAIEGLCEIPVNWQDHHAVLTPLVVSPSSSPLLADFSESWFRKVHDFHGAGPRGYFSRTDITTLKLCGLLHLVKYGVDAGQHEIDEETARVAIDLTSALHFTFSSLVCEQKEEDREVVKVTEWITKRAYATRSMVQNAVLQSKTSQHVHEVLEEAVDLGWLVKDGKRYSASAEWKAYKEKSNGKD